MTPFRGWEPDAPVDDTITRAAVLSLAHRVETFGRVSGRPWHRDDTVAVVSTGGKGLAGGNGVAIAPLDQSSVDTIAEVLGREEPAWILSPWSDDAPEALGFVSAGHPPFMAMWPGTAEQPPVSNGVVIEEARTADDLAAAERVLIEGYPVPEAMSAGPGLAFPPRLAGTDTHVFVGRVDGTAAGVAVGTVAAGVQHVEYVATLEHVRGKGIGAAVTWAAATVDPALPAVLVSSDLGRPVYERLGFRALTRWTFWLRA